MGIRSGVEVDWFRLPVVYRLGDGWVALYGFVLFWDLWWVSWWGDGLGGMSFYVMMWVLVMGSLSERGLFLALDSGDDSGLGLRWWRRCSPGSGGVLSHARLVVGLAG